MYHSLQHLDLARTLARERDHQARPVNARTRRKVVRWLRRTADRAVDRAPVRSRFDVLLRDRAAAARTDLLEIAGIFERTDHLDPSSVADLERLLSGGCGSPLYNPAVHPSELRATLYYARSRLELTPHSREVSH